ncbi:hypothetical protein [Nocardia brasiliensis]|uniref:hypothetical protein n=1 Tax=Nocardia brasiliensis TaxID=37326 RepID=UPI002456D548|nr:hypothetical protein [Nocardia brasiliensis]
MKMTTTTMVFRFENTDDPEANTAAINALFRGQGWYVADPDTPACGSVIYVGADKTTDGIERMFCCDLPADHPPTRRHRQVTDADEGQVIEWSDEATPS